MAWRRDSVIDDRLAAVLASAAAGIWPAIVRARPVFAAVCRTTVVGAARHRHSIAHAVHAADLHE